jgi:hypothetical protein
VQETGPVRGVDGRADVAHDGRRELPGQRPPPVERVAERLALEQLHDDVGPERGLEVEVMDRHDVRVCEACGGERLPPEALEGGRLLDELGAEHLHRHGPVEHDLRRAVHGADRPSADERLHAVLPAERPSDERVRHRSNSGMLSWMRRT